MAPDATVTQEQPKAPQEEKQANCLGCSKPLKKIRRYYRDGKFYCTKKCWNKFIEANSAKEKEEDKK